MLIRVAGPLARLQDVPLALADVQPRIGGPTLPMMFDIFMGLHREDVDLKREVEAALMSRRAEIDAILGEAGVPRLDVAGPAAPTR